MLFLAFGEVAPAQTLFAFSLINKRYSLYPGKVSAVNSFPKEFPEEQK